MNCCAIDYVPWMTSLEQRESEANKFKPISKVRCGRLMAESRIWNITVLNASIAVLRMTDNNASLKVADTGSEHADGGRSSKDGFGAFE